MSGMMNPVGRFGLMGKRSYTHTLSHTGLASAPATGSQAEGRSGPYGYPNPDTLARVFWLTKEHMMKAKFALWYWLVTLLIVGGLTILEGCKSY